MCVNYGKIIDKNLRNSFKLFSFIKGKNLVSFACMQFLNRLIKIKCVCHL